ncbi:hypothetical protein JMJ35_009863 [Cladonia borealis]|uniref:Uncharacterized protein n=1 Tax=Cladonia borealis TaxID=184061 RepID=A0AA39V1Y5_9LECA|nr:hypothetical protein JMJ35_009863 [Cladonia borealis]
MGSSSSPPSKSLSKLPSSISQYLTKTNATITRLNRLISKTPTLDTTLLTTTYTLHLLHALLSRLQSPRTLVPLARISALTSLLDEYRILLRLTGLLGIYSWACSTYTSPPHDVVLKYITWAQVLSCAVFQGLENAAFLAGKGVLGWKGERVGRAWRWSARAWGVYVGLELGRLGWEGRKWQRVGGSGNGNEGGKGKGEAELVVKEKGEGDNVDWEKWKREVGVNAAYAPMTVHYSLENGVLSEGAIGALGVVVAWLTMGKAWRECA